MMNGTLQLGLLYILAVAYSGWASADCIASFLNPSFSPRYVFLSTPDGYGLHHVELIDRAEILESVRPVPESNYTSAVQKLQLLVQSSKRDDGRNTQIVNSELIALLQKLIPEGALFRDDQKALHKVSFREPGAIDLGDVRLWLSDARVLTFDRHSIGSGQTEQLRIKLKNADPRTFELRLHLGRNPRNATELVVNSIALQELEVGWRRLLFGEPPVKKNGSFLPNAVKPIAARIYFNGYGRIDPIDLKIPPEGIEFSDKIEIPEILRKFGLPVRSDLAETLRTVLEAEPQAQLIPVLYSIMRHEYAYRILGLISQPILEERIFKFISELVKRGQLENESSRLKFREFILSYITNGFQNYESPRPGYRGQENNVLQTARFFRLMGILPLEQQQYFFGLAESWAKQHHPQLVNLGARIMAQQTGMTFEEYSLKFVPTPINLEPDTDADRGD